MMTIRLAGMRLGTLIPICALACTLSACASMQDLSGISRPGYQKDGSYVLTSQEQQQGCRALEERSRGLQEQMQELSQRAVHEMQQVPSTVASAWGRLFGDPGEGVPAVAAYNEARAESAALNATLTRNGCNGSGIDTASIKR
jgi:hypothetical protein